MDEQTGVVVTLIGAVPADAVVYAQSSLEQLAWRLPGEARPLRLKLTWVDDPEEVHPARVQVSLDLNGRVVRAHQAGHTFREATDLAIRRIIRRVEVHRERQHPRHPPASPPGPAEWRRGHLPDDRPSIVARSASERKVLRCKTLAVPVLDVDEAAAEMDLRDYDLFLFTNAHGGDDAIVFRRADRRFGVQQASGGAPGDGRWAQPVVRVDPAPECTLGEARELLEGSNERFLFFVDPRSRRAHVLYRRYDGHYGLLRPEGDTDEPEGADARSEMPRAHRPPLARSKKRARRTSH
jgi:hypothetical protein